MCLEKGSYILNYSGCTKCNKLGLTDEKDRVEEESDDGEETVTYTRMIPIILLYIYIHLGITMYIMRFAELYIIIFIIGRQHLKTDTRNL